MTMIPSPERATLRAKTITSLAFGVGNTVLVFFLIFWLLRLLGIDPAPMLASAGVVGLAVGFGAQSLVKDFVSGLFIILENQYGVGDRVKIGGTEGVVEKLTIRSTVLRDIDGHIVYIPNGTVTTVVNIKQGESGVGHRYSGSE